MKDKYLKILYMFILLQPFIDLITSLMTRFDVAIVSLGVIIRGIFIVVMLCYLFFFNRSKYRKTSIIYIILLGVFYLFYLLTKKEFFFNFEFLYNEIVYIFKYSYFPILFISCMNFVDQYKIDRKKIINLFVLNLLVYAIMIVVPTSTKTGFNSYNNKEGYGIVGWFYSANEISAILTILYPFLFLYLDRKFTVKHCAMIIITIIAILSIGTKAPYYGMLIITSFLTIYYLFNIRKKLKQFILVALIIIVSIAVKNYTPANVNLEKRIDCQNDYYNGTIINNKETGELECQVADGQKIVMLSGRDVLLKSAYEIYKDSSMVDKFFGIGFSNREVINNGWISKLVEMDLFDVLFRYGIIGFIIYMLPVGMIIFKVAVTTFKSKFKLSFEQIIYGYGTAIGIGFGFFIGHVFGAPSVSFYLAFISVFTLNLFDGIKKKKLNRNKITFLSLHLGVGGIENATINTANSLCKDKDVQIICFYRLSKDNVYDIDERVKIKYLYEGRPNKEELLYAIKNLRILSIIKNSWIASRILWKKHFMMKKEIKNIKEGIVVSTRIEFTTLLNRYGNKNILKVAQEHYHHNNNKKYIRTMYYHYFDIDYVLALTEGLKKDYEQFLNGSNTKVITMPNMLAEVVHKSSNLDNNNVIFVGRLDAGKRINEIIDIASKLKDNKWTFKIIGDGKEKENLMNQIKENKLTKKVVLLGSKTHNEVLDELYKSSIFIMTSISEGLPMVLLEAMSIGVPCIAYETESGVNDIISNNIDGFVIKNRNETEMIQKLEELMNNVKLRKEMGKKALVKAHKFSKEKITDRWNDFIDNAIIS